MDKNKLYKVNTIAKKTFIYAFLIMLAIISIMPFYLLIVNSTMSHQEISTSYSFVFKDSFLSNFQKMVADTNNKIFTAARNSLIISLGTAALATYFSAATAYGIHMYNFKGKKAAFIFILIVMMIPTQIASIGLIQILYKFKLMDSYIPLIIPSIASPAVFFFIKQYMDSVLPYEVVESARVDGSSEIKTFHSIVLPMMKPALSVQFIFSFVASWNNFFMPALIITSPNKRTIPMLIAQLRVPSNPANFDLGPVYMMIAVAVIPVVIVYFIFSKFIIKGVTLGSVKG